MKTAYVYRALIAILLAILGLSLYFEFKSEEKTFISFNDGSVECMTITIQKSSTKEQLAEALGAGRAAMLGEIGKTPGCVNYEIIR